VEKEAKVLQIVAPGKPEWRDMPVLDPEAGEVLVKVNAITTCPHWDLHIMAGEPMFPHMKMEYPYTPGQPGHEMVGEVSALGAGVEDFALGDRVAAWQDRGQQVRQGCYAQYVPFATQSLLKVPDHVADEQVVSLELAMCVQVSFDQLEIFGGVKDQKVGISGLGPAGLIAARMAKAYGAREVVAFDPLPERRAQAADIATVLPPDADAFPANRFTDESLDLAIDCTGFKNAIQYLMDRTRRAVAIFGVLRETIEYDASHRRGNLALIGYENHNHAAGERALALIADGKLDLEMLATCALPFARYAEGVELLRAKEATKIRFLPWGD
jgi:2-desacetyl-2-hydroxyethyl bacteriochlorophyllide A dehydrogenase